MDQQIRIMIAEDHRLIREGYRSILKDDPEIMVIGEACNGKVLIDLLRLEVPDIVILDLEMPVMNGAEALHIMTKRFPQVKTIIVSQHYGDMYISDYIMKGARGYLSKSCSAESLAKAIHTVHTEGYFLDKNISMAVVSGLIREKSKNGLFYQLALSEREIEVLRQICDCYSNKVIADNLNICVSTVDYHRKNIYRKTNTGSVVALVKYAMKNGIIEP